MYVYIYIYTHICPTASWWPLTPLLQCSTDAVRGHGKEAKASWCLYNWLLILWSFAHVHARGSTKESQEECSEALRVYDTLTDDAKRQQFSYWCASEHACVPECVTAMHVLCCSCMQVPWSVQRPQGYRERPLEVRQVLHDDRHTHRLCLRDTPRRFL